MIGCIVLLFLACVLKFGIRFIVVTLYKKRIVILYANLMFIYCKKFIVFIVTQFRRGLYFHGLSQSEHV
jgi:hypothetical protein